MTFYEKYETLCAEINTKPQNQELLDILGVTSPTISGWKKGSLPKAEVLCRMATYFRVTTDYLLGLSELRSPSDNPTLSDMEQLLVTTFRNTDTLGQANIIHACLAERDRVDKGKVEHTENEKSIAAV